MFLDAREADRSARTETRPSAVAAADDSGPKPGRLAQQTVASALFPVWSANSKLRPKNTSTLSETARRRGPIGREIGVGPFSIKVFEVSRSLRWTRPAMDKVTGSGTAERVGSPHE
jgi:hypothetical protein